MEMLIVVAIIAVLIAIAIPVMTGAMHKAKVAADLANVRAYYAELQVDYLETGEHLPNSLVPYYTGSVGSDFMTIKFPKSGETIKLHDGYYLVDKTSKGGYWVRYYCKYYSELGHEEHELLLE